MDVQEGNTSRRGSLAISALLNEDTAAKLNQQASGDVSSGTTSPVSGSQTISSSSKVKRKRISPVQYNRLMEIFDQTDTPSSEIRENLADELKMTKREVQVWFQNRRAKVNRTKNTQGKQPHRHSIIPTNTNSHVYSSGKIGFYKQVKPRRASAYPLLEGNEDAHNRLPHTPYPLPPNPGRYPIAPMPTMPVRSEQHISYRTPHPSHQLPHHAPPPPPAQQSHHHRHMPYTHHPYSHQRKPSAIDLLASAAEYVRTDHKEMTFSRS